MKFKEAVLKMIESHSGVSSKRVCGFLGWMVCLGIIIYCTISNIEAPEIVNNVIYACLGLLGIDSVTGIWKGK